MAEGTQTPTTPTTPSQGAQTPAIQNQAPQTPAVDTKGPEKEAYRLVFGKHFLGKEDGIAKYARVGDKVMLTKAQAEKFKNKFAPLKKDEES